jgi:hypothetical protein
MAAEPSCRGERRTFTAIQEVIAAEGPSCRGAAKVTDIQEIVAAEGPSAGGRRGKERVARNERSSDWRRGAAGSPDPDTLPAAGSPDPDTLPAEWLA